MAEPNQSVPSSPLKALSSQAIGHTQASRNLSTLADEYFCVEERTLAGWLNYVYQFAKNIAFVDNTKLLINDSWQSALPDEEQAKQLQNLIQGKEVDAEIIQLAERPDIALLLAFFQIMNSPQSLFKQYTQQHKQFYYRNILGFRERPQVADKAHLVVKLIDDAKSKTLPKGTLFSGAEDADGNKLIYQSINNAILNRAQVNQLFTLSRSTDSQALLLTQGYHEPLGQDYPEDGLLTFGAVSLLEQERQSFSQLGFTLASQELYLSSGERTVTLEFNLKDNFNWKGAGILCYFDIKISTEQGQVVLTPEQLSETIDEDRLSVTLSLDKYFSQITHFIDEENPQLPSLPYISFLLKADCLHDKTLLSSANFSSIFLKVRVSGLTNIVANHDEGSIDTAKPFEPFTYSPKIGSNFHFTHPELLIKNITSANLDCRWVGRPFKLDSYFLPYIKFRQTADKRYGLLPSNDDSATPFWPANQVKVSYSDSNESLSLTEIFSDNDPLDNIDKFDLPFIVKNEGQSETGQYSYSQLPLSTTTASGWPKWFSLTLSNNDFGHHDYAQVSQYFAHKNLKESTSVLVSPPYTPLLNEVFIDYCSEVELKVGDQSEYHQLNHIHPLGRPGVEASHASNIALIPKLDKWGYLYIGVAAVPTPGQFRLYFQLDPVDGSNTSDKTALDWSYLDGGKWSTFSRSQGGRLQSRARIIEDSTYNLLDSGVITFELPTLQLAHNFMGNDLFWIRVSVEDQSPQQGDIAKYSRIRSVQAQGVQVMLMSDKHHASHYAQPLPADSINSLIIPDPQISEVLQPFSSFSAKQAETAGALEVRASERTRHKNRALTHWDFEHLVLAEFPELFMARCFRNQQSVDVVVVPVNYDFGVLQPKVPLFLKRRIQRFLSTNSALGLDVRVIDPVYEEVTFTVTLNIVPDYDMDSAVAELNQILIGYMTPWNKQPEKVSNDFPDRIHLTQVGTALERHPAVDIIYNLRARVNGVSHNQIIAPSSSAVILVPVFDHEISLLNQITEVFEGIGKWKIEDDFQII